MTGYEIKLNMADETKVRLLESKIAVARRELNKLRSDMHSIKKMFVHKFKEVKEMVETGEVPFTFFINLTSVSVLNTDCIPMTKGRLRVKSSLKSMGKMQTVVFSTESCYHFHH